MEGPLRALVEHLAGPDSAGVLRYACTLLGSNLNSENWALSSEDLVAAAITKRLAEASKAKAIQFGAAHRKLQQRPVVSPKARKALLHCLYLCAGHQCHAMPSALRLDPAEVVVPERNGGLVDSTGHLRAQLRALTIAEPAPPGPTRYWPAVPEASVLQDVLFVAQGIAGQHLRLNTMTQAFGAQPGTGIPKGSRQLIREVCEAGWLYQKLEELVRSPSPTSLLHQSLCSAIKGHLAEYFKLLALLQAELHVPGSSALSLRKLLAWMHEPCKRLKHLLLVADGCRDLKGGILASKVHDFVGHGDPAIRSLMANVMRLTYQPLLDMVVAWTTEGELRDPYGEFFISVDRQAPDDQFWERRYSLAMANVPAFISIPLAEKILLVGKSINFIRVQCDDPQWAMSPEVLAKVPRDGAIFEASAFEFSEGLQQFIHAALHLVNKRLMHLLFVRFKCANHALALKRFLLLAQGDFIQSLMDSLQDTLSKRAAEVYRHNLVGTVDSAVKATNTDKDWDVAPFLDVSLQAVEDRTAVSDKVGWDVFCLEYRVTRPLDVLFPSDVMRTYSQLFRFLWRVKRLENDLAQIWRKHMTLGRLGAGRGWGWRGAAPIQRLLLQCNALRSDMVHFVFNFQYYLMFEVLEVSWTDFDQKMRQASSLDDLIAAHTQYLGTLQQAALLTPAMQPIRGKLDAVLAVITQFVATQDCLFAALVPFADQEGDTEPEADMDVDSAEGEVGSARSFRSTADRLQEERTIHEALHRLQDIAQQFKEKFRDLLQLITFNAKSRPKPGSVFPGPDAGAPRDLHPKDLEFLRYLGFRLDFNEFFSQNAEARPTAPYPSSYAPARPSQGTAVLSRPEAGHALPTVPYRTTAGGLPATSVSGGAGLPSAAAGAPGLRRF